MIERLLYNNNNALEKACYTLEKGGIIVYPTDTIYGFGCDSTNDKAIRKLNKIKNRNGPMSVLCPNINSALEWINLSNKNKIIVKTKFAPQTTVIVPVNDYIVSKLIMGRNNTLGLRFSNHPFCEKLSNTYPQPITSTSVNRKGELPQSNPNKIANMFSKEINLIIEDGNIKGTNSKIYFFNHKGWETLR